MPPRVVELEGESFSDLAGFYSEVSRKLVAAPKWEKNLDSLSNIFWEGSMVFPPAQRIEIRWKDSKKSRIDLSWPETSKQLESRLKRCPQENRNIVDGEISRARRGEGGTVFDWIVRIFLEQSNVTFVLE